MLRSIGLENDLVGSAYRMSIGEIPRLLAKVISIPLPVFR
jgi:hypothetical protein